MQEATDNPYIKSFRLDGQPPHQDEQNWLKFTLSEKKSALRALFKCLLMKSRAKKKKKEIQSSLGQKIVCPRTIPPIKKF